MAKTLSNSGIVTGQTIKASEVSQSIDALTGTEAYDITISGSLTVTGSTSIDGDVFINPTSANTGTSVLTINPTTGKIFRTGSYSTGGGGGGSVGTLDQVTTLGSTTTNAITTGNITSTGIISASGDLYASVADNNNSSFKVVVYDTATGRFYRTGSFSSVLVSSGSKVDFGDDEIVFDDGTGNEGAGLKGDGTDTILIEKADGTGGKLDVGGSDGTGVIIIGDTGEIKGGDNKGELKPGSGDGEWEIVQEDGTGGKLDVGGSDGIGTLVIGKEGAVQGDISKGKFSPVLDGSIQEDGHFQVLKNDGSKGEISTNIKAGTNTTVINDNYHSTGYIELTGSIFSKSNITASGAISASGNLIAKKIIVDAEGSGTSDLDIQFGNDSDTGIASIPSGGDKIGIYTGGAYRIAADNFGVQISTDLQCAQTVFISGSLNISGSTGNIHISASGDISASGNISASLISAQDLDIYGGFIDLKNDGTQSQIKFYCEDNNAHYTKVMAAPHAYYTGNKDLVLPAYNFDFATPAFGTISAPVNVDVTGKLTTTSITASGAISASGNIQAGTFISASSLDIGPGGNVEIDSIAIRLPNLPTSDPGVAGRVWRDGTDLKISV